MNIIKVWLALSPQRQLASVLSVLATLMAFYFLVSTTLKPKTDLLYSGLDPAAAGEIVAKLEGMNVTYEVKGNAIYADSTRRDSLRLELARDGLPRQSVVGYELFDDMNSFAMTSDMFDTAYWRAKEGELARTLLAMPTIRTARVHLGTQKTKGFATGPSAKTASVTIAASGGISPAQAKAIQYMTALSVAGLNPSDVAVIDTVQGVIAGPGIDDEMMKGGMGEIEQAAQIKSNLLSLLEARVGRGNARVSVSLDFEREHITTAERRFDPDSRVVKSQTTSDVTDSATGTNNAVTVASNLPEGQAGGNQNNSDRAETSETVTYEISEIMRNSEILPGGVKRLSVAVLLNDIVTPGTEGEVTRTPRSEAEMADLTELVTMAAGLDTERGDALSVKSLAFDIPLEVGEVTRPTLLQQFLDRYLWSTLQALILGLVVLLLGMFVVRPLLAPGENQGGADMGPMALPSPNGGTPAADQGGMGLAPLPALGDMPTMGGMGGGLPELPMLTGPQTNNLLGAGDDDPINALKEAVSDQTQEAAALLTQWLDQDKVA